MARQPIIAGNWKMNGTVAEAAALAQAVVKRVASQPDLEVVLCPPFTAIFKVAEIVRGTPVALGAQNLHWERQGAYTGEVSAPLLRDLGCRWCIIGHSERRIHFGETDGMIRRKLRAALESGLKVILCVGETLPLRQQGKTWEVVESQLQSALEGVEPLRVAEEIVIAYEPVWAIGTGQNATPGQAQEVHGSIRSWLTARIARATAQSVRIQYGGSVKPENAGELLSQPDVDGALVGGASLDSKAFLSILEAAIQAKGQKCSTG